jgi:hypothetical protein
MNPHSERVTWLEHEFLLCAICDRDFASLYHHGLTDMYYVAHRFVEPSDAAPGHRRLDRAVVIPQGLPVASRRPSHLAADDRNSDREGASW